MENMMSSKGEQTRNKILDAAQDLVMSNGFAGTSIDEILRATDLTKGAFFHHFKGKGELARELVERYTLGDLGMFERFAAEVEAKFDDPLEQLNEFLQLFEHYICDSDDPAPGCMYAVYTYESSLFDPGVLDFVADTLRKWTSIYVRKYQEVIDVYPPALKVTARQLAEMTVSVVEGGLILQRAWGDTGVTCRQSEQLRNYLFLLFGAPKTETGNSDLERVSA